MEDHSTHFIFDGEKVIISPDLYPFINFLQEIEKEIESLLWSDNKLESIKKYYTEIINLVRVISDKLIKNSIDFNFTLSEHPDTIIEKFKTNSADRSKMIILFANLETLLCLNIAYENKTSEKMVIIKDAMDPNIVKGFYENFCLNQNNEWGKKNHERLKYITADDLRKLRNSLTHFYSLDKGLQISNSFFSNKSRELERKTNFKVKFISPDDLYEMIKGVAKLLIEKWSNDCKDSQMTGSSEFKDRMLSINELVRSHGAMIIGGSQLKA